MPGGMAIDCDFAVVADKAAFRALASEWDALFERSGRPRQVFQTFAWLWCWAEHYLDGVQRLSIVVGRREGRLVLAWPLVSTRRMGLRILSFMGEPLSQYGDALVEEGEESAALMSEALRFVMSLPADILSLRRVREDAALGPLLASNMEPSGARAQAPFVDFTGALDSEALERRFSPKQRSGRRRHLRRLADLGPVSFERHEGGPTARALAATGLAFKREWARRSGYLTPALSDARFERFFVDAAGGGANAPDLRVSALFCGGEPIGVEIAVACKGQLFGHVLAPKPGFEKQGAGSVLAGYSIAAALKEGFGAYDLLAPADPYKMDWASGCVNVSDFAVPLTPMGRLFKWVWLDFGREALKSLARGLAPSLRRLRGKSAADARR